MKLPGDLAAAWGGAWPWSTGLTLLLSACAAVGGLPVPDAGPPAGDAALEGEGGAPGEGEGLEGEGEGWPEGEGQAEGEGEGDERPCPGAPPPCARSLGVCTGSNRPCVNGGWQPCRDEDYARHSDRYVVEETTSFCDQLDNDCDGETDEACECRPGQTQVCGRDQGECRSGVQRCEEGRWAPCPAVGPTEEVCDGRDNDCDGQTDEVCECAPGAQRPCGSDVGECRSAVQVCMAGRWSPCDDRGPTEEECDGLDNDCDNRTDEDAACPADHTCRNGDCERDRWVFEAEAGSMGHDIGRRDGEGWSARTDLDPRGVLVYGPYTADLPAGTYDALFRMKIDVVNADNNKVARIEINDFDGDGPECGFCVIEERDVYRREWRADQQYQDIPLRFVNPGRGHRLEFRTYWYDTSYVNEDRITVVRVEE